METTELKVKIQTARMEAIEYISYGAKTSGKIIQKLQKKGYDNKLIKEVLLGLSADGYIKDEAILLAYWKRRSGSKRESINAFTLRMSKLGINKKVLEKFKSEHPPESNDAGLLLEFINAKFAHELEILRENETDSAERQKLCHKIIRNCTAHGFRYETILDGLRACAILLHV